MAQKPQNLAALPLPPAITSTYIDCTLSCGLTYHTLQAGKPGQPLILFCHGYPELAYSWRQILGPIAADGYFCVAMDQRGCGRTTGWEASPPFSSTDPAQYTTPHLVRDLICLVYKLGYTSVTCIVGHDFGAVVSATAALVRPDVFKATVQLSHPHHAPPQPPLGSPADSSAPATSAPQADPDIHASLLALSPPRKHYKWYNSTPQAVRDWEAPAQGLRAFLRGYFFVKSGDWAGNAPHALGAWSAEELAKLPGYYVMGAEEGMPEAVARLVGTDGAEGLKATEAWLSEGELGVYVGEWARTGFGGALGWYRAGTAKPKPSPLASSASTAGQMLLFAGRRIEVPVAFVSGAKDWGNWQQPGALESYEDPAVVKEGCWRGCTLVEGAGHWVQQERPREVVDALLGFLGGL